MTGKLLPDRIELPGGGWVTFRDEDTLTGKDVFRIKACIDFRRSAGEIANDLLRVGAEVLITGWSIPGHDKLPIPSHAEAGLNPVELLPAKALKQIEKAIAPVVNSLHRDSTDDGDEDPTGPGSG